MSALSALSVVSLSQELVVLVYVGTCVDQSMSSPAPSSHVSFTCTRRSLLSSPPIARRWFSADFSAIIASADGSALTSQPSSHHPSPDRRDGQNRWENGLEQCKVSSKHEQFRVNLSIVAWCVHRCSYLHHESAICVVAHHLLKLCIQRLDSQRCFAVELR